MPSRRSASTPGNQSPAAAPAAAQSRLGTVLRFTPQAACVGVRQLESGGFRVASSRDFRTATHVANDFGGADVQYFERFGIAIVRRDGERLRPMLQKAMEQRVVSAARAERSYRALGEHSRASAQADSPDMAVTLDYLRGYRDAVDHLVDRMTAGATATDDGPGANGGSTKAASPGDCRRCGRRRVR